MIPFIVTTCQVGAERVLKAEIAQLYPAFRASFSRPGLVTFKIDEPSESDADLPSKIVGRSIFARFAAFSIGKISTSDHSKVASECRRILHEYKEPINQVHVFERDRAVPGDNGLEPGSTADDFFLHQEIVTKNPVLQNAEVGADNETFLDVIRVDDAEYLVGVHRVSKRSPIQCRFPGGVIPITLPSDAASRAWLKFEEGLRWSRLPIECDSRCADIGASPGGGSQTLLARGAFVLGVDPAEMAPEVLRHPNFTHLRGKTHQLKRSVFRDVQWIIADMNVAPNYTMDVLDELLSRKEIDIHGILCTLKLFQWNLVETIPTIIDRFKRLGFHSIRVKQLAFNRQEVMLTGTRHTLTNTAKR